MNRYSNIIKQEAINLYRASAPATEIGISLSTSRSTVYKWIKKRNDASHNLTKSSLNGLGIRQNDLMGLSKSYRMVIAQYHLAIILNH